MDYKISPLAMPLQVEKVFFPEIRGLYFGILGNDKIVFDYDRYFADNDLEMIDCKLFMRSCKRFINALAVEDGLSTSDLFYQNKDGHTLVSASLVFVFLMFSNSEMLSYFNQLLMALMSDGVAYSNGFIYNMAAEHLPTDVLQQMIQERENEKTGDK